MKRTTLVIIAASGAIALAVWQLAPAGGKDKPANDIPEASPQTVAPGYTVHFDENGNIVAEATPADQAELEAALSNVVNTSSEGLVEKPLAGGGMKMDLQGRFQSASTAFIDSNGNLTAPCVTNEAEVKALTSPTTDEKE